MSTETTKKKIKIDNGTNFARAYTDKAIDAKMPTDLKATATSLSLLAGATKVGSGINLSGFEYDEATKTLKASGGGGKSVSPCLKLLDIAGDSPVFKTSLTEEEKTNLENGLYNSVFYADQTKGEAAVYAVYFPETLVTPVPGTTIFSTFDISIDETTGTITITGASVYGMEIGEKNAEGTYPITVQKVFDATIGGGSTGPSLPEITADSVGKFLTVTSEQKTAWVGVSHVDITEIVLDYTKADFGIGDNLNKIGNYLISSSVNPIYSYWSGFGTHSYEKVLLMGMLTVDKNKQCFAFGTLYGYNNDKGTIGELLGSGAFLILENTPIPPISYLPYLSVSSFGGVGMAIPANLFLGAGKTASSDIENMVSLSNQYGALRYDFKKTFSETDAMNVTSSFFGRLIPNSGETVTQVTLIGIFDNGMGKAVLEKNESGVFESKSPIEYVADVNAVTYSKARYKHVVNLTCKSGGNTTLSAIFTGYNSSNLPIDSYQDLTKLFAGETLELHGKVIVNGEAKDTKYLDLHGGGINMDNIAYWQGGSTDPLALVAINLDQFAGLTIADDVCLPK